MENQREWTQKYHVITYFYTTEFIINVINKNTVSHYLLNYRINFHGYSNSE